MSILIGGIEMPTEDFAQMFLFKDGRVQLVTRVGAREHKAVSVPTPHGRLIDADALLSQYGGMILTASADYAEGLRDVIKDIQDAPTIIEAEEGE